MISEVFSDYIYNEVNLPDILEIDDETLKNNACNLLDPDFSLLPSSEIDNIELHEVQANSTPKEVVARTKPKDRSVLFKSTDFIRHVPIAQKEPKIDLGRIPRITITELKSKNRMVGKVVKLRTRAKSMFSERSSKNDSTEIRDPSYFPEKTRKTSVSY